MSMLRRITYWSLERRRRPLRRQFKRRSRSKIGHPWNQIHVKKSYRTLARSHGSCWPSLEWTEIGKSMRLIVLIIIFNYNDKIMVRNKIVRKLTKVEHAPGTRIAIVSNPGLSIIIIIIIIIIWHKLSHVHGGLVLKQLESSRRELLLNSRKYWKLLVHVL